MAYQFTGFSATKPIARLIDSVKGKYEAFFIYYDADSKKRFFRQSKDINRLPIRERKLEAEITADALWDALNKGWNPCLSKLPDFERVKQRDPLSFEKALDFAYNLKQKELSKYSAYDYAGCVRFMKRAAKELDLLHLDVSKVERPDIRAILTKATQLNNWSPKARNKYLTILKALLSVLVDIERIPYNPAHKIRNEAQDEAVSYRPATEEEKNSIAAHLTEKAPDFFEYLMLIYQSGIRRKELLLIEVRDINIHRREITIRPEVAKTNKQRIVPVPDDIYQILMRREVYNLPKKWFLFSSNQFAPGPEKYHPNTPTSFWRKLVIAEPEKGGLGIDCKMYGMKHTGADDKIRAGIDLDVLKTLYGHKSKRMTENYAKAVKEKYSDIIKTQSPVFAKVVEMKKKSG